MIVSGLSGQRHTRALSGEITMNGVLHLGQNNSIEPLKTSHVQFTKMTQEIGSISMGDLAIFISAIAVLIVYLLRKYDRRRSLRIALLKELKAPAETLEDAEKAPVMPDDDFIPTRIYESSAADLGRLSDPEVEKIVEYYSLAFQLKNWLNDPNYTITIPEWYFEDLNDREDIPEGFLKDRAHSSEDIDPAVERARHLNTIRKEAVNEIECRHTYHNYG